MEIANHQNHRQELLPQQLALREGRATRTCWSVLAPTRASYMASCIGKAYRISHSFSQSIFRVVLLNADAIIAHEHCSLAEKVNVDAIDQGLYQRLWGTAYYGTIAILLNDDKYRITDKDAQQDVCRCL